MKYEVNNRRSVNVVMDDGYHKDNEFIEVTEWANGEGYDIVISERERVSIHFTEWDILKKIIKKFDKGKI
jgi:hypothetical protein